MQRRSILSAIAAGLAVSPGVAQPTQRPLRIGVTPGDPESWSAGQILRQVYAKAGVELQFVPQPPARAVLDLISGELDANLMRIAGFAALHPQMLKLPTPLYREDVVVAWLPSLKAQIRSREDLQRYSLGGVRGFFFVNEITEGHPSVTLTQSTEQLARMLVAKRVDLALDTTLSMRYVLARLGLRDVRVSPALATLDLYHYLHPRHGAMFSRLEEVLHTMSMRGELASLARQFDAQVLNLRPDQFF